MSSESEVETKKRKRLRLLSDESDEEEENVTKRKLEKNKMPYIDAEAEVSSSSSYESSFVDKSESEASDSTNAESWETTDLSDSGSNSWDYDSSEAFFLMPPKKIPRIMKPRKLFERYQPKKSRQQRLNFASAESSATETAQECSNSQGTRISLCETPVSSKTNIKKQDWYENKDGMGNVTLKCTDGLVYAHAFILAGEDGFFKKHFHGKEFHELQRIRFFIETFSNVSVKTVELLIQFSYLDSLPLNLNTVVVMSDLVLRRELDFPRLKAYILDVAQAFEIKNDETQKAIDLVVSDLDTMSAPCKIIMCQLMRRNLGSIIASKYGHQLLVSDAGKIITFLLLVEGLPTDKTDCRELSQNEDFDSSCAMSSKNHGDMSTGLTSSTLDKDDTGKVYETKEIQGNSIKMCLNVGNQQGLSWTDDEIKSLLRIVGESTEDNAISWKNVEVAFNIENTTQRSKWSLKSQYKRQPKSCVIQSCEASAGGTGVMECAAQTGAYEAGAPALPRANLEK